MLRVLCRAAAFLVTATPLLGQVQFSSPELGFSMTLPSEFTREGDDPLASPATVACFVTLGSRDPWIRLCVERLRGPLPQGRLSTSDLPAGAKRVGFTWKGMDTDGVRVESQRGRDAIVVLVALVPIRKTGIRLRVESPRPNEARAQAALVATLASVQGETNWVASTERASRAGSLVGQIGVIIMAVGAGMWIMQRRLRKKDG